jgi:hypothetical protein
MITLYKWYQLKKKEIQFKLSFYRFLEQLLQAAKENKEDLKQQFLHDFEEMLHMASAKKEDET